MNDIEIDQLMQLIRRTDMNDNQKVIWLKEFINSREILLKRDWPEYCNMCLSSDIIGRQFTFICGNCNYEWD